jgi:hypothetical protein
MLAQVQGCLSVVPLFAPSCRAAIGGEALGQRAKSEHVVLTKAWSKAAEPASR